MTATPAQDPTSKSILVIGAAGRAGRTAVAEARRRGHRVTAVVRDPAAYDAPRGVEVRTGDVTDPASVRALAAGKDAVIAGVFDQSRDPAEFLPAATRALLAGAPDARLVWVGLASLLPDVGGTPVMDRAGYPQAYRSFFLTHLAALDVLRASAADWVAVSPSGDFDHTGSPVGGYAVAPGDAAALITYADHAIALVDEAVAPTASGVHLGVVAQAPARSSASMIR
ncbi:NAD(P)-dependent oxidoreductase [Nocardioides nitrophenolicus]|uniref:NAD(P)-dependent oxidoreductase n=1 Tax=Nocardioides nitrophenolicus TaxID=60489 RepID=UPI00195E182B|nr:NAD(P)H-binding protein [Nocardioides nitrophenolicus]MBM7518829.1 putative NADH-flavin reductase [Nocardioides nitrophenolicus]